MIRVLENFKTKWEIQQNWQLVFPLLGISFLFYSCFKLSKLLFKDVHFALHILTTLAFFFFLLFVTLKLFKVLEKKWQLTYRWEMIRVFIVFAITGSSSLFIGRPIIQFLGINKENLNTYVYWFLYLIFGIIFYQLFLVFFGWLFGQFQFFWEFEKKMLRRFGLGKFLD